MVAPSVVIQEVLDRSVQGTTNPFICRGDDDGIYYVKGVAAGRRSLICEWVAAQLATALGVPVADYALAEVPDMVVEWNPRNDIRDLGAGLVFASRSIPHAQELTTTTRDQVPAHTAQDVLVFDWWLHNEDRSLTAYGGNPNLWWDTLENRLVVMDHNLAFDPTFNPENFLSQHVFASHWNAVYGDHELRAHYQQRLVTVLPQLGAIRASIPPQWWWVDDGVPASISWDAIEACLNRCCHHNFWNLP